MFTAPLPTARITLCNSMHHESNDNWELTEGTDIYIGQLHLVELSAATCCQFPVLTWPTVLTAHWCGEVTGESDGRQLWDRIVLTGLTCLCVGTVNGVFIYRAQKG